MLTDDPSFSGERRDATGQPYNFNGARMTSSTKPVFAYKKILYILLYGR